MRAARVLVVDDDPAIREMLHEYLGANGFDVEAVGDGAAARAAVAREMPDVVLLDVGLPGEDGLSLARWLRQHHDVGIVMVTAADDVVDRVVGLEMGADDYVAKPFDPRVLPARLKSVRRRVQDRGVPAPAAAPAGRLPIGRCTLDLPARRLLDADGREITVTTMEFDLLRAFAEHPNQVLSRDRLLSLTRNREWEPFDRSIDIRIARVRRKVEDDPDNPQAIRTVRGAGYMYVPPRRD
jgi:two-component system phosphate regulon response regulator OmpR